ncbi:MAG: hypothetical protein AAF405_04870 [Pseudomonadota bacterium]
MASRKTASKSGAKTNKKAPAKVAKTGKVKKSTTTEKAGQVEEAAAPIEIPDDCVFIGKSTKLDVHACL